MVPHPLAFRNCRARAARATIRNMSIDGPGTDAVVAGLSAERRALLDRLLRADRGSGAIPRRAERAPVPLTYAQQRLWFLEQFEPDSGSYTGVRAFRLRGGTLDPAALAAALDALAARHESLRTTIDAVEGEPVARVAPAGARFPLALVEAPGLDGPARDARAAELARAEASAPLDLRRGPLARAVLVRFAGDDHALLLAFHHLVTDRWSTAILERELGRFWSRAAAGLAPDDLPPLAVRYGDFAAWERARSAAGEFEPGLAYWRDRLAGAPPPPALPHDRIDPPVRSGRVARIARALEPALVAALREYCRAAGATPFMVLQAGFAALLHRYGGGDDVLVGTPVAGRTRRELADIAGLFVNTLVLRTDCGGDPSFDELVGRVRAGALDAFDHQDVPFEKIVEALAPSRELDATPFFRVMFALQNAPPRALDAPGLSCEEFDVGGGGAKFDLTVMVEEHGPGALTCKLEYDDGLFDRAAVERTFGHYAALLAGALAEPARRIAALPLLSAEERRMEVCGWNATARPFPRERGVGALFADAVAAHPGAVALRHRDGDLTYAELDRRAEALAARLRAAGLRPGGMAGVFAEHHPDAIVAFVAIVKAGAAYVPLDIENPPERVRALLAGAGATLLLTHAPAAARLGGGGGLPPLVRIDEESPAPAVLPARNAEAGGDDLIYVIYTSGSTGAPKGVEVRHRGVTRMVCGTDFVAFGPGDVMPQTSSFAFDAATFEIWGPLLNGGTSVLCDKRVLLDPAAYARMLRDEGATLAILTPVVFNQIARRLPAAFGPLRDLFVGGEALDPSAARLVLESGAPPRRLINGYGPTESTTFGTSYVIERIGPGARSVPIGRPIANTTAYVVDARLEPVPVGVPGELLLGGPGIARGYRGRPDLTAERFVGDVFSDEPGATLYHTGDIVRRLADGTLDYLGRADGQVKIRGFRIELGEIEARIAAHAGVAAAAVVVQRAGADSASDELIAYVVPHGDLAAFDLAALRAELARVLPVYMLPAAYVTLPALPTKANGKLDRAALPAPARERAAAARYVAPRTPLELELVAIWEALLDRHPVGVDDDFFESGGHSLLAVRMLHRLETATGKQLPVRTLFERPTIALLAAALAADDGGPPARCALLRRGGERAPFVLFHGFLDGGVYALELARRTAPDRPFLALHPHDADGAREPLPPSIEAMAEEHLRVIRELAPHGPYVLGGFCNGGRVAYEAALRLRAAGEEVPLLVIFTTPPPNANRRLRDAVGALARLRGAGFERELDLYAALAHRLDTLRSPARLRAALAQRFGRTAPAPAQPPDGAADAIVTAGGDHDARWYGYLDRISRYVPARRFDGRVVVVWGRDARAPGGDPAAAWRPWARSVEVRYVAGGAISSLNEHVDEVAAALRDALDGPGGAR